MPIFGTTPPPPPPQQDVPVHQRTIDFTNDLGSGFRSHRELKDNAQRTEEGMQHESSQQDVPAEHYDVSPEQYHINAINEGKYGEGFQATYNTAEQSTEEEQEMGM